MHIDEIHNIYTTGLPHHGKEAFHPVYGRLGEFCAILPVAIPFQALSAMFIAPLLWWIGLGKWCSVIAKNLVGDIK